MQSVRLLASAALFSCIQNAGGLVVNIGVLAADAPVGTHPDYFCASIEKTPGHFANGVVTFNNNGKKYSVVKASGDVTPSGATFSGSLMMTKTAGSGSFSR